MVNYNATQLDKIFSALSDSTRREMLARLTQRDMSVQDLSAPFNMSKPAISKHLKVLESAGLMQRQIRGRMHICRLASAPLSEVADWLAFYEQFWQNKMDSLDQFLADKGTDENA